MANKYRLQDLSQLSGRGIFVDANILIYLFWPTGQYYLEQKYANAFGYILRQKKNDLYVDFLVISEVINRVMRELAKQNPTVNFKKFRDSPEGKEALSDIYLILKDNVLSRFKLVGRCINADDIAHYLIVDELDFVDKAIVTLCQENSLVLLTNDNDFRNVPIDVLTGNPKF